MADVGKSKLVGQIGNWISQAKTKYQEESSNPNSTLSKAKSKIGEVSKKIEESASNQVKTLAEKANSDLFVEPTKVNLGLYLQKENLDTKEKPVEAKFKIDESEVETSAIVENKQVEIPNQCSFEKKQTVYLEDFVLQLARKEVKHPSLLSSITGIEERHLTISEGFLIVFRQIKMNAAKKQFGRFFASKMPSKEEQEEEARPKGIVKSVTSMDRLFKMDVFSMNKNGQEVELVLCFVNKDRNPKAMPEVKRYLLKTDDKTKAFLRSFDQMARKASKYYKPNV